MQPFEALRDWLQFHRAMAETLLLSFANALVAAPERVLDVRWIVAGR
jgi:hypothetical protein